MPNKKAIEINDLAEVIFLSQPAFNPSGTLLAYVQSQADVPENKYNANIRLYDLQKNQDRHLTAGDAESSYIWLDDQTLLFAAQRSAKDTKRAAEKEEFTAFYSIRVDGGEAQKLFEIPAKAKQLKALTDSSFLFTMLTELNGKDLYTLKPEEQKEELKRRKEEEDYEVFEEVPFWLNGQGVTNGKRTRLCRYDLKTKKISVFTEGNWTVSSFALDEDKKQALVVMTDFKDVLPIANTVQLLDLNNGKLRLLRAENERVIAAEFLDKEYAVIVVNRMHRSGLSQNPEFFKLQLKDGKAQKIEAKEDFSFGSSVASDMRLGGGDSLAVRDGKIYHIETRNGDAVLLCIDPQGKSQLLVDGPGSVDSISVAPDGSVAFVGIEPNALSGLYLVDSKGAKKALVLPNQDYLKKHAVAVAHEVIAPGEDGDEVQGWVLQPKGYTPGKKYPAILDIHGGPKTAYGTLFFHEMQVWASKGYFVFFCNPRGSDGKGSAYADIRGKYGQVDYRNLMSFTDKVLETYPDIDPERLGVTGGSYGGFMTNWIIGQTDRFKAACAQRSISNWILMYASADIGYFFAKDQVDADPWSNMQKMWDQSPLKYADKAKTPTLFIHSDEDYRCWMPEAVQMFKALKLHGVEARMVLFHGENHELSRSGKPKHRIRRLEEITNWFEKYLK
jgi:dipeptidyl aminopeptidase/acylaminoacyl peptidase